MTRIFLILIFILTAFPSFGFQESQKFHFQDPLVPQIIRIDSSASVREILQLRRLGGFDQKVSHGTAKKGIEYWFEIDFAPYSGVLDGVDSLYVYPGHFEQAQLYYFPGGKIDSLNLTRLTPNDLKRSSLHSAEYVKIARKDLLEGSVLLIKGIYHRATPNLDTKVIRFSDPESHSVFSQYVSQNAFKSQILAFFFLGVASVLMVFNLILFFYMKEKQYIYYGAFLLFQLIYYSQISPYLAANFGYNAFYFFYWLTTVSQLLINLFYLLFIRHFLEFPRYLPRFDQVVLGISYLLFFLILSNSILIFFKPYSLLQSQLMDFQRYFMAGFAFFGVGYLYLRYPNQLKYFVISATLIFTTGALLTMFLLDLDYMVAGSSIESIIFALGLSYKIKLISQQKQKAEKEAFQTKLGALRAQINPHFIFNSLSSIQHLISSGQKEAALSYLSKFSKFVRQVLEHSIDVQVSLEKEIELLKVYLDLEALRFDHAFSYQIETPPELDLSFTEVPMLIVQPFVENAIKHGLMPKREGQRMVSIRFIEDENHICCQIEDNGIGRKAAQELKKKDYRPSRGMSLTAERLRMVNQNLKDNPILIEDLEVGTRVTIKFPKP